LVSALLLSGWSAFVAARISRVVGEDGIVRARGLIVVNDDSNNAIVLEISSDGAGMIHTYNSLGTELCRVSTSHNGFGYFAVMGPHGIDLANMGVIVRKLPAGTFVSKRIDGAPLAVVGGSGDGDAGGVAVYGLSGKELISLSRTPEQDGVVNVNDVLGRRRCSLVASASGGTISIFDGSGQTTFTANSAIDEGGAACVYDELGEQSVCLVGGNSDGGRVWLRGGEGDTASEISDIPSSGAKEFDEEIEKTGKTREN